jgi:hypothetical protein
MHYALNPYRAVWLAAAVVGVVYAVWSVIG